MNFKPKNDEALLAALRFHNPDLNHKQILQMFGLKKALEIYTLRELRTLFDNDNSRSWYRLIADAKKIKLPSTQSSYKT